MPEIQKRTKAKPSVRAREGDKMKRQQEAQAKMLARQARSKAKGK